MTVEFVDNKNEFFIDIKTLKRKGSATFFYVWWWFRKLCKEQMYNCCS